MLSIEVDEGRRLAAGLVKMLTGGDTVAARMLYRESFEFRPRFKLWLAANNAPLVRDDDGGLWRRIVRIPFVHSIPPAERDPAVKATLRDPQKAGAAILASAVQGCLDWQRSGLGTAPAVDRATTDYREEMDPLANFLAERCTLDRAFIVPRSKLRAVYETWAKENGETALTSREFTDRLRARDCDPDAFDHGQRAWRGIGLLPQGEE